jgi:hypothetical protein
MLTEKNIPVKENIKEMWQKIWNPEILFVHL